MYDSMPFWFWFPLAIILWSLLIILITRSIARDPHQDLSRLDRLDGITDSPRR